MFRKILRMNENIPAQYWMFNYFNCDLQKWRGRNNHTLAQQLNNDCEQILKLSLDAKSIRDIQLIAQDEKEWMNKVLTSETNSSVSNYFKCFILVEDAQS